MSMMLDLTRRRRTGKQRCRFLYNSSYRKRQTSWSIHAPSSSWIGSDTKGIDNRPQRNEGRQNGALLTRACHGDAITRVNYLFPRHAMNRALRSVGTSHPTVHDTSLSKPGSDLSGRNKRSRKGRVTEGRSMWVPLGTQGEAFGVGQ